MADVISCGVARRFAGIIANCLAFWASVKSAGKFIMPGAMAFTQISGASSFASDLVAAMRPAFDAL